MKTDAAFGCALLTILAVPLALPCPVSGELITINDAGTDTGNDAAFLSGFPPDLSADGRLVVFTSAATDLVPGLDTNGALDVFMRDRLLGTTELISIDATGSGPGNDFAASPTISDDGRMVAFSSEATDLVATDTNGLRDIFVRDLMTGSTTLVSINALGDDTGDSSSFLPIISPDGSSVVFVSFAADLVSTDTNGAQDVFVRDLATAATFLATINFDGTDSGMGGSMSLSGQVPSISANGRRVAYPSDATDLIAGDVNGVADVFVFDLDTGLNVLVSPALGGTPTANGASSVPAISADGTVVAFASTADNLVATDSNGVTDFFARDLDAGTTDLVSRPTGGTDSVAGGAFALGPASISADGDLVAFTSFADALVAGDDNGTGDVFVHDRSAGTTNLVSATPAGGAGNRESFVLAAFSTPFSADSRFLIFVSNASDLTIEADSNNTSDVYWRDLQTGATSLLSVAVTGGAGAGASFLPTISAGGASAAFLSNAANLTAIDTNGLTDVFAASPAVLLFADGFESGDLAAWPAVVP